MCRALFIAVDHPPPLVPWDEHARAFNTVPVQAHEQAVAAKFSKPHLVYAGAHTGCSCGFQYGVMDPTTPEEMEEEQRGRASVEALRRYLEELLVLSPTVEVYCCWEGDWAEPQEGRQRVTASYFGGDHFELAERVFLEVFAPP
jgi:hypothetical protein